MGLLLMPLNRLPTACRGIFLQICRESQAGQEELFCLKGLKSWVKSFFLSRWLLNSKNRSKKTYTNVYTCVHTKQAHSRRFCGCCLKWLATKMVIFSLIRDRPSALDCLSHKWFMVSLPLFFTKTIKMNLEWKRALKGKLLITYWGCLIIICCFIFSLLLSVLYRNAGMALQKEETH